MKWWEMLAVAVMFLGFLFYLYKIQTTTLDSPTDKEIARDHEAPWQYHTTEITMPTQKELDDLEEAKKEIVKIQEELKRICKAKKS